MIVKEKQFTTSTDPRIRAGEDAEKDMAFRLARRFGNGQRKAESHASVRPVRNAERDRWCESQLNVRMERRPISSPAWVIRKIAHRYLP